MCWVTVDGVGGWFFGSIVMDGMQDALTHCRIPIAIIIPSRINQSHHSKMRECGQGVKCLHSLLNTGILLIFILRAYSSVPECEEFWYSSSRSLPPRLTCLSSRRCHVCAGIAPGPEGESGHYQGYFGAKGGSLLCKAKYANWHSKYVSMRDRKTKYTFLWLNGFTIDCRTTRTRRASWCHPGSWRTFWSRSLGLSLDVMK